MMPWVKLDDQFPDHPKIVEAGPLAGWLYVAGLAYCGRFITDGFIPRGQVRRLADLDDPMALAARLVAVHLWEEAEDGYHVHDYLHYNPSSAQVKHEREQVAKRQQEFRDRKSGRYATPDNAVSNAVTPPSRNGVSNTRPVPVLNVEVDELGEVGGVQGRETPRRADRATRLPEVYPLTAEMREWAARRVPGLDLDFAHEEFCTYWRGEGKTKLDWFQTWQNGMLKSYQRAPVSRMGRNGQADHNSARRGKVVV